jgi:hypothetical protein
VTSRPLLTVLLDQTHTPQSNKDTTPIHVGIGSMSPLTQCSSLPLSPTTAQLHTPADRTLLSLDEPIDGQELIVPANTTGSHDSGGNDSQSMTKRKREVLACVFLPPRPPFSANNSSIRAPGHRQARKQSQDTETVCPNA